MSLPLHIGNAQQCQALNRCFMSPTDQSQDILGGLNGAEHSPGSIGMQDVRQCVHDKKRERRAVTISLWETFPVAKFAHNLVAVATELSSLGRSQGTRDMTVRKGVSEAVAT